MVEEGDFEFAYLREEWGDFVRYHEPHGTFVVIESDGNPRRVWCFDKPKEYTTVDVKG